MIGVRWMCLLLDDKPWFSDKNVCVTTCNNHWLQALYNWSYCQKQTWCYKIKFNVIFLFLLLLSPEWHFLSQRLFKWWLPKVVDHDTCNECSFNLYFWVFVQPSRVLSCWLFLDALLYWRFFWSVWCDRCHILVTCQSRSEGRIGVSHQGGLQIGRGQMAWRFHCYGTRNRRGNRWQ